jgi:small subunit ribosomal protein S16
MAVKMRLMRMGKKRSPFYRVVVIDGRAPRDGRYIDLLGRYDPNQEPSLVEIDSDKAIDWLKKGAQPTEAVRKLLEISGTMSRFKVVSGKIHTVAGAPAAQTAPAPEPEETAAAEDEASTEEAPADEPATDEPTLEEAEADTADDTEREEE